MLKVFISHRHRGGGSAYAHIIANRLKELGVETFLDVRSIMNGKFEDYIDDAIKACTDFVVILTPNCLDSQNEQARVSKKGKDVFLHEIDLALKEHKNILPVPIDGFNYDNITSNVGKKIKKYQNATGNVPLDLTKMDAFIEQLISYFGDKDISEKLLYKYHRILLSREITTHLTSRKTLENDTIYERWHTAKRVKILSVSASAITEGNRESFLRCMDEGVHFDVIIYDPSSDAAQFATRSNLSNGSKGKLIEHIRNGYQNLMELKNDPQYCDKLDIRLTRQYIPAAFSIVEREGEGFSSVKVDIVAMSAVKFEPRSARAYEIYENDKESYLYYQKMFEEVWNDAVLPQQNDKYETCDICNNLQSNKRLLFKTKYWSIYLANNQNYFGRVIAMLNKHKGSLTDLSDEEWMQFHRIANALENIFKTLFGATLMNWECLMNGTYRKINPTPHVHFHCVPRFGKPVYFNKKTYVDTEFGSHQITDKNMEMQEEEIDALYSFLIERITPFIADID
ncbi:MAG: TIR domain-containing protein [Clostridia bacterium]|nr:TIR domain-containing protein [Clostridia bacterium]